MIEVLRKRTYGWLAEVIKNLTSDDDGTHVAQANRIMMIGWIAFIGFPLYYWIWKYVFPQPYESIVLRLGGMLCAAPLLGARRWVKSSYFYMYTHAALTYMLPFFFTFMFLMNNANPVWSQSLLIATVALFHFGYRISIPSYFLGTLAAFALHAFELHEIRYPTQEMIVNIPTISFAILLVSVSNISRQILQQQRLNAMATALGSVAHELRTPLISISGFARGYSKYLPGLVNFYVKHNDLAEPSERKAIPLRHAQSMLEVTEKIQAEVNYMNSTIDLLLTNAGRPQSSDSLQGPMLPTSKFAIAEVVQSSVDSYPFANPQQRALVRVNVVKDHTIDGHRDLLRMIIVNLIKNSLHAIARTDFNREHHIEIIVNNTEITVRDSGCGIAPEQIPHIFTRFHSFPQHSGTGIGLAFCRDTLKSWGAKIQCESDCGPNSFTEFKISFPAT